MIGKRQNLSQGVGIAKRQQRHSLLCSLQSQLPERHIYAAINQLRDHLAKLGDYQSEPDSTIRLHSKEFIEGLCKDFQNIKGFDKITAVGTAVEEITNEARKNTAQMIANIVFVERLDEKRDHLKQKALLFESTSQHVKHKFFSRGKIKVIAAIYLI